MGIHTTDSNSVLKWSTDTQSCTNGWLGVTNTGYFHYFYILVPSASFTTHFIHKIRVKREEVLLGKEHGALQRRVGESRALQGSGPRSDSKATSFLH